MLLRLHGLGVIPAFRAQLHQVAVRVRRLLYRHFQVVPIHGNVGNPHRAERHWLIREICVEILAHGTADIDPQLNARRSLQNLHPVIQLQDTLGRTVQLQIDVSWILPGTV